MQVPDQTSGIVAWVTRVQICVMSLGMGLLLLSSRTGVEQTFRWGLEAPGESKKCQRVRCPHCDVSCVSLPHICPARTVEERPARMLESQILHASSIASVRPCFAMSDAFWSQRMLWAGSSDEGLENADRRSLTMPVGFTYGRLLGGPSSISPARR
jgi:hypothetical protein